MQAFLALLAVLALVSTAEGGLSAPNSSVAMSRDGTKMLVMLSPYARGDQKPTAALPDGRVLNLHQVFPKSGVYNSSTLDPVWQVGWFSLQCDLRYSDDLRHVVRLNRQGFRSKWALAFYDEGKLVRTYDCATLLTSMRHDRCLPYSTWDWHTRWYDAFALDEGHTAVTLSTARRQTYIAGYTIDWGRREFYTFDLASGDMVSRRSVGAWVVWAYGAALAVLVVAPLLAVRRVWRRIRMKRSSRRRGFYVA